jgi:hypothetical protein
VERKWHFFVEIGYKNKVEVFIYLDLDGSLYFFKNHKNVEEKTPSCHFCKRYDEENEIWTNHIVMQIMGSVTGNRIHTRKHLRINTFYI